MKKVKILEILINVATLICLAYFILFSVPTIKECQDSCNKQILEKCYKNYQFINFSKMINISGFLNNSENITFDNSTFGLTVD